MRKLLFVYMVCAAALVVGASWAADSAKSRGGGVTVITGRRNNPTVPAPPVRTPPALPPGARVYSSPSGPGTRSGTTTYQSPSVRVNPRTSGRVVAPPQVTSYPVDPSKVHYGRRSSLGDAWYYPGVRSDWERSQPNVRVQGRSTTREYLPTGQVVVTRNRRSPDVYYGDRVSIGSSGTWHDLGSVSYGHGYYAPGWGYTNHTFYPGRAGYGSRVDYRKVRASPYRHLSYVACPWYQVYYYPTHPAFEAAAYYAPGFAWRFSYQTDAGYWDKFFGYGYGGGVRFGECDWMYSWYPFGGFARMIIGESVPMEYTQYIAPRFLD